MTPNIAHVMLFALSCFVVEADKDTQAAAATRKKLEVKVTVDFKDEPLNEILKELKKQVEDAKAGTLSWTYDTGVSQNQKISIEAKSQSVAEVLDGLLKKNGLGYIVISKAGDRYDGWLKLKQGNERGYAAGEEPKGKAPEKNAPKEKDKTENKAPSDDYKAEKAAQGKLDLARELIKDGKKDRAKQRLEELIKQYPNTKAAVEAKKEIDKLSGKN